MRFNKMKENKQKTISWDATKRLVLNGVRIIKFVHHSAPKQFYFLVFFTFLVSLIPLLGNAGEAFFINEIFESSKLGNFSDSLIISFVLFCLALIFSNVVHPLRGKASMYFENTIRGKSMMEIVRKNLELDVAVRENPKNNNLFTVVRENESKFVEFTERMFSLFENIISFLFAFVAVAIFNWWSVLIIFFTALPEFIWEAISGGRVFRTISGHAETRRKFGHLYGDTRNFNSSLEIRLFQSGDYFISNIQKLFTMFSGDRIKMAAKRYDYRIVTEIISTLGMFLVLGWFVYEAIGGKFGTGQVIFVFGMMRNLRGRLASIFSSLGGFYEQSMYVSDIFKFLDLTPFIKSEENSYKLKKEAPEIIFENVSFQYPDQKSWVLKKVSFKVKPGEKIALVGINGAGKTTLVKLLCRFYDPTEGRILLDGRDLKEIDLNSWHAILGTLFQDYANYNLPVSELIKLGDISRISKLEDVRSAAKSAEADSFIQKWENNYDQVLGKGFTGGIEPSGGQWQRLALARVFFREPRVYILDEPTAAVDSEAEERIMEEKVFEKFEGLPNDRTVILISHRFSTVRRADKILVLDGGELVEEGGHGDLMKLNSVYAKLFNLQAKGYK
jgi:ABC-type multidrug transport system fused ATPase/permease subunit